MSRRDWQSHAPALYEARRARIVYEHVSAERFEQRPVRTEPLDGLRVLISQGLAPGKRIVVQGAELIDHIR